MIRPGRILYKLWYEPLGKIQRCIAEGGPWEQRKTRLAQQEMIRAAAALPPSPAPAPGQPTVQLWFLTGARYWYQSAFCLRSFETTSGLATIPVFVDDGSLVGETAATLRRIFPAAIIRAKVECDRAVTAALPPARFPALHERRNNYVHLRKLLDVHAGNTGWHLVLDSDMLFFRRPDAVVDWLARPTQPLIMRDVDTCYGYSRELMQRIAGVPIPERINVGLTGLRSESIDWERLEHWCARLVAEAGTSYFLEQALIAMLVAHQPPHVVSAEDYVLIPSESECRQPTAVLHHYVMASKIGYYRYAWRHHAPAPAPCSA